MRRSILAALGAAFLLSAPVAAEDVLKTAVDGTFAPHAMPKLSGGIEGFNVDLADALARQLNKKITVDSAQFSGLLPALQAGTYDFIVAPVTVTKERAENLLFTEGYLNTDFQFITKTDAPDITKLEDLKGKVVASTRDRPTTAGRAGLRRRSAGRFSPTAPRPTPCRRCCPAAPTPTSPATPRSPGR